MRDFSYTVLSLAKIETPTGLRKNLKIAGGVPPNSVMAVEVSALLSAEADEMGTLEHGS